MTLTPPEETEQELVLAAPDAALIKDLAEVEKKKGSSAGLLPDVGEQTRLEIGNTAKGFVKDVMKFTPNSPEYIAKVREINTLANKEIQTTTSGSNRMLDRASSSIAGSKRDGSDTSMKVASTLGELRSTIEDLAPGNNKKGLQRFVSMLPGGNKINKYFQRYESAKSQLDAIVVSLSDGRNELEQDNNELAAEKASQWENMLRLREYVLMAEALREELQIEVANLRAAGNLEAAHALETDMLFAVNQRYQDLTTQITVAAQGYMAMELIRKNNIELIKGVERAENTTLTALRTSVMVAQALDQQKVVIDQIDEVNAATNKIIASTGTALRQQTELIHAQASSSGVSVETLTKAFDDIFATINSIDTYKVKANASMEVTIQNLSKQLERAKPQLDRVSALEAEQPGASDAPSSLEFHVAPKAIDGRSE